MRRASRRPEMSDHEHTEPDPDERDVAPDEADVEVEEPLRSDDEAVEE